MPKEPQPPRSYGSAATAAPYPRPYSAPAASPPPTAASSVVARAVAAAAATSSGGGGHRPARLTINNFASFRARVKKLPPDANVKAALHTQLYQFAERVCFGCVKCRRDNVESDCVAVDLKNRIMLCTPCFTRIIRPRTYAPSRVVPFPSLLSWLNYKPAHVMEMSEDALERPAEAVAPSGQRMAAPMLTGGDRATALGKLPAIAMSVAAGRGRGGAGRGRGGAASGATLDDALAQGAAGTSGGTHPCLRVWGVCQHGETCLFRNAPADLCLAYLMGLCRGPHTPVHVNAAPAANAAAGGGRGGQAGGRGGAQHKHNHNSGRGGGHNAGSRPPHGNAGRGGRNAPGGNRRPDQRSGNAAAPLQTCRLLHQEVYDLPDVADPPPRERFEGDLEDEEGAWAAWVRRRRDSPNSAEWQLWHNGPVAQLFRTYVPVKRRPAPPRPPKKPREAAMGEGDGGGAVPVTAAAAGAEATGDEVEAQPPVEGSPDGGAGKDEREGDAGEQVAEAEADASDGDQDDFEGGEMHDDGDDGGEAEEAEAEDAEETEAEEGEEAQEDEAEEEAAPAAPATKLNFFDIMSALKGIKKDDPAKTEE